ncbi:hypothetical protein ACHHYP_20704 [Achlya hypogyna]|uniref:Uncharacterized protein n=1 Tax=Achlya hypogyna TaxID=1202772 RepID=A0A1V9YEE2_ACHHY|nr:hypothetical protein ACHHYP_20704 [Achlya hypogyna]
MGFSFVTSTPAPRRSSMSMAAVLRRRQVEIPPPIDMVDLGSPRFPHLCMTTEDRARTVAAEYKAVPSVARHLDHGNDEWRRAFFGMDAP